MLGLDHHPDARGLQDVLDRLGDLGGQLLLDLQPAGEAVDHPRQLGDAHHPVGRQVADVGAADHRQHVVLAEADHPDILQDHQLVIAADLLEGPLQILPGIDVVAGEQLAIGLDHPAGRVAQAFAAGVVPRPFDQHPDGGLRLGLRGFAHPGPPNRPIGPRSKS